MKTLIGAKTYFSIGESILEPEALVKRAKSLGYETLMVADVDSISAMTMLFQAGKKCGIKIVIGAAITVSDDITWRRAKKGEPKTKKPEFHRPNLWVANEQGLHNLIKLLTLANDENHYYYQAQVTLSELCDALRSGGLVYSTGSAFSALAHSDYAQILDSVASAATQSKIVLEVVPAETAYYDAVSVRAMSVFHSDESKFVCVVSKPCYSTANAKTARNTMNSILRREQVDSMWRNEPAGCTELIDSVAMDRMTEDLASRIGVSKYTSELISNTDDFANLFTYEWDRMPISLPSLAVDPFSRLVQLCVDGWSKRVLQEVSGYKPPTTMLVEYRSRLKYELKVLKEMGFENYFLLVQDLTSWCKNKGIMVGPGRGSVGGSLVAFLIGITDVDPIRFGLFFERFINPERIDLPDIDLDFMASRRHEVLRYLEKKYGKDKVAQISNYNAIHAASAIRSVGSVRGLSQDDVACSKLVPKEHGIPVTLEEAVVAVPEIEKFAVHNSLVWDDAIHLQGVLRGFGKHAAAIVVAGEPIQNRAVLEKRQNSYVINWDKRVVEDFGLVKLDILGLQTLDLLTLAAKIVKDKFGEEVDYTSKPLDDPKVLDAFGRGETVGVFQFESSGMRKLLRDLSHGGRLAFEDIAAATALYRPGPMESGLMESYINIKSGTEYPNYLHPSMQPALEETDSVIVYQEQVMQIARDLAGFSMAEADHLRKAMGKKDKDKMAAMRQQWVDGCKSKSGLEELDAGMLFDQIEAFAGYGFNKSHSIEYSVISYWSMWLKTYFPHAFFAAALTILDEEKRMGLVKDAERMGITVEPPDANLSTNIYEIDGNRLIAPFQAIKGCSEKGAEAIIKARKDGNFKDRYDLEKRVDRRACNIRVIEALDKVGGFAPLKGPGSRLDPARLTDQKALLPGLISRNVKAERMIVVHKPQLVELIRQTRECSSCSLAEECHPQPRLGKQASIMVISDCPNWGEAKSGKMGEGDAAGALLGALKAAGLSLADVYLTSLVKAPKGSGGQLTNEMINGCSHYLEKEIQMMNPPVIVTLGSNVVRHLLPDVRGGWEEICGQVHYLPSEDRTIICGFNPMMIHFDSSKQVRLNQVFKEARDIVR